MEEDGYEEEEAEEGEGEEEEGEGRRRQLTGCVVEVVVG